MRARGPCVLVGFLLLPAFLSAAPGPRLTLSPAEWQLGMIRQGTVAEQVLTVTNGEAVTVTVTLIPTCSCNEAIPRSRVIPAGSRAEFLMRYDSADDRGVTTKSFLVQTDLRGVPAFHYWIRGTVRESNAGPAAVLPVTPSGTPGAPAGSARGGPITITYYYTPGCRTCEEFLSAQVPVLEKRLGLRIVVQRRDLLVAANFEELSAAAAARGQGLSAIPALLAGDTLLQGDAEIQEKLPGLLASLAAGSPGAGTQGSVPAAAPPGGATLAILPVIAAGLIDGINPCAFTTLIFLLASLALAGRGRGEVLVIGALFSTAVFLSYFLIGLGLFTALRAAAAVSLVSVILRWILVGVLFVFAVLSVYDYTLIRSGRPTEMLLQLPSSFKKRIHTSIRTRARVAALAGSSFVLGFLVSVFEFACTGQVYLPLLGYLARTHGGFDGIGLLALYNVCFILPLLLVFGASWLGVSSTRITTAFQAHMGKVKLGLAVVFAGLAVLTLVG
jgi:cytochrome c biogenesis protein CcdA